MNLKNKILLLMSFPFVLVLLLGGFILNENLHRLQDSRQMRFHNQGFAGVSHYIHEVQKERAKSMLFLGKKLSQNDLNQHRDLVDQKKSLAATDLKSCRLPKESADLFNSAGEDLKRLREKVDSGMDTAEGAKEFGQIMDKLIAIQIGLARSIQFENYETRILSLTLLTTAKEYTGRLRAVVINVLAQNRPLTSAQLVQVNNLKGGVVSNVTSPALSLSSQGFQELASFKDNADWKHVMNVIDLVVEKSTEGNYGQDPNEFYKSVTAAIDAFLAITDGESQRLESELVTASSALQTRIYITVSAAILALLTGLFLTWRSLQHIMLNLKKASEQLHSVNEQIKEASQQAMDSSSQLSSASTQAAASLEETVASLEELSSMVKQNSLHADEASRLSHSGAERAAEGERSTEDLITSMRAISNSSTKIQDISNVIDDIAFQINLLALNAAVEAARAGEQGRGFAVVADAVRTLAQRSASATKDIATLISESVQSIDQGTKVAAQSSEHLKTLATTIKQISQINGEIARGSQEQTTGFNQINEAMNQIDSVTQTNAGAADGVSRVSQNMARQVEDLSAVVGVLNSLVEGRRVG